MRRLATLSVLCLAAFGAGGVPDTALAQARGVRTVPIAEATVTGRRVATDPGGLLQILFVDGTAITVGPGSELVIDSFVHDRTARTTRLSATLRAGTFRYIDSRSSSTGGGAVLATPHGTLTIQDAGVDIDLGGAGRPAHFDMVFGDEMTLSRGGGGDARVYRSGYSIVPGAPGQKPTVRKTPREWLQDMRKQLSAAGRRGITLASASAGPDGAHTPFIGRP